MMQPSILGQPGAGFIPETAPTFARRNTRPQQPPPPSLPQATGHSNTVPPSRSNTHNHLHPQQQQQQQQQQRQTNTPSAGSDFIHVDRSNRRMAAAPDRVDSWIEVASQPSDSYTSSSSSPEDVVTTGLNVQLARRRLHKRRRNSTSTALQHNTRLAHESSEDDSEEIDEIDANAIDSIGSSITDPSLSEGEEGSSSDEESDEEDEVVPGVAGLSPLVHHQQRPQYHRTFSRDPPQPDHDAALRASLSTLLACAAAGRSLSKTRQDQKPGATAVQEPSRPAHIPTGLSLVTDAEREAMMTTRAPQQQQQVRQQNHVYAPQPASPAARPVSPRKRTSGEVKAEEQINNAKKTPRSRRSSKVSTTTVPSISTSNITYLTLAISAGAVIIVSAISFSAGYALGKEVGRNEMIELSGAGTHVAKSLAGGSASRVGSKIVMSSGFGSGLRSITVS